MTTSYKQQADLIWRPDDVRPLSPPSQEDDPGSSSNKMSKNGKLLNIVRCGTLAPSSHNTQCWKFEINNAVEPSIITVHPDFSRRCPVVDQDDHHLYATLGCAIENIFVAAKHYGFDPQVNASEPTRDGITVRLFPPASDSKAENDSNEKLYQAIFERQCTRNEYDGNHLSSQELKLLKEAGTGDGVQVHLITAKPDMNKILDHILEANTAQMEDPSFMKELKSWVRFSHSDAVATKDGLPAACFGNPSVPRWIGGFIFDFAARANPANTKIRKEVASSSGFAVFVSDQDDPVHWVEAGRCYERFALQGTAMGIRNAFLNQPVEVAQIRPRFAQSLNLTQGTRPDLLVRFGKGPAMPRSLRRPLESVVVSTNVT